MVAADPAGVQAAVGDETVELRPSLVRLLSVAADALESGDIVALVSEDPTPTITRCRNGHRDGALHAAHRECEALPARLSGRAVRSSPTRTTDPGNG
ncbi:MAG: hypothetical protein ACRDRP_22370 [Pseudonocardiaceae bacterium]